MSMKICVLFVCLGNICRSPMAEAVFRDEVEKAGVSEHFEIIDSCGTGAWHVGSWPDPRTVDVLFANGIHTDHVARKLKLTDFKKFDYIFAMDRSNLQNIKRVCPSDAKTHISLFGDYGSAGVSKIVEDPYYGGDDGFQLCYEQLVDFSRNFIKKVVG
ncbi:dual specificity phosphatase Stp1 [Schizosaccharomyces octosporus yFS286]|uniref:Low molecular weight phosphotyrosine protein phosphatase n=1 Tax=Schizosaccharomyces octosporus (strain yFS286) TaxID=483514 RepID=S9Q126_SCHOY|nr:dual specificity phosphatase Stp1 [Schizosaccharomyces octosporus yFS286]EPX73877.1 dual specificity phosphatase Stp1 [Schizosaccharomyces octosporus yFS286]